MVSRLLCNTVIWSYLHFISSAAVLPAANATTLSSLTSSTIQSRTPVEGPQCKIASGWPKYESCVQAWNLMPGTLDWTTIGPDPSNKVVTGSTRFWVGNCVIDIVDVGLVTGITTDLVQWDTLKAAALMVLNECVGSNGGIGGFYSQLGYQYNNAVHIFASDFATQLQKAVEGIGNAASDMGGNDCKQREVLRNRISNALEAPSEGDTGRLGLQARHLWGFVRRKRIAVLVTTVWRSLLMTLGFNGAHMFSRV
ncbi:MAG: hypothetical protein M1827_004771 [Pycnora praestabilis]|nr:MAG: hypothetical protein M1827_004771 [Pycnora praestabilis]